MLAELEHGRERTLVQSRRTVECHLQSFALGKDVDLVRATGRNSCDGGILARRVSSHLRYIDSTRRRRARDIRKRTRRSPERSLHGGR